VHNISVDYKSNNSYTGFNVAPQQNILTFNLTRKDLNMTDFNAQLQKMFQPSTELLSANAKVLETALAQQSSLVNQFITSSLDFNKQLLEQKDFANVQNISEQFAKNVSEQVTSSNKEIVAAITAANEKSSEIIKEFVETSSQSFTAQAK